jgi:hypothetical protein
MKTLFALAFVLAVCGANASESFEAAVHTAGPTHPSLYSFADVYRLTVSGGGAGVFPTLASGEAPIRVAVTQSVGAAETQFSVVSIAQPGRWGLLLAGVTLALWVARRRLGYFF